MAIAQQYERVMAEVGDVCRACGRAPEEVTVVAVSKTVEVERIAECAGAGCRDFGENRPERIMATHAAYPDARWHFIGNVQGRRIRDIVPCAALIHSVFKAEHLRKVDDVAGRLGKVQRVLLEVNVSGEASKSGAAPDELDALLAEAAGLSHVRVAGLMTMAPQGDLAAARAAFAGLRRLRDEARASCDSLSELSMGMSEDWRVAIEEGATIVRIGRAIFQESFA